jgi:hypothetical protein
MEAAGTAAAPAAEAPPKPVTPEEEALRRNTDCVYFLASPVTCKKVNTAAPIALFAPPPCSFGSRRLLSMLADCPIIAHDFVRGSASGVG